MTQRSVDPSAEWQRQLPILIHRKVALREPNQADVHAIGEVLHSCDGARFGLEAGPSDETLPGIIERWAADRANGSRITFAVLVETDLVGLIQIRPLHPRFESAEWDMALAPDHRGTGIFFDAAHLAISFVFGTLGTNRLEARVAANNGRAMGAMRKLGAVQEGVLRRAIRQGDQYADQALWALLNDDWWHRRVIEPRVH
ncbi:MAG TPA: GNAT family N-acetyltransferase [Vicinamibacterales bacterium]|jgi:RimJ/RimL family protein N-acetyltransferase|nr:GNAT family N-acetyltransferase [Vicinamibacterales bacterium]